MIKVEQRVKALTHRYMKRNMGEMRGVWHIAEIDSSHLELTGVTVHTCSGNFYIELSAPKVYPGECLDLAYKLYVKEVR